MALANAVISDPCHGFPCFNRPCTGTMMCESMSGEFVLYRCVECGSSARMSRSLYAEIERNGLPKDDKDLWQFYRDSRRLKVAKPKNPKPVAKKFRSSAVMPFVYWHYLEARELVPEGIKYEGTEDGVKVSGTAEQIDFLREDTAQIANWKTEKWMKKPVRDIQRAAEIASSLLDSIVASGYAEA